MASRCFPGTVRLALAGPDPGLRVPWPRSLTLTQAVAELAPADAGAGSEGETRILFGSWGDRTTGLQTTFDGWSALVTPSGDGVRLGERDYCVLAGVAAGALAVAELFFETAGVNVEATRRAAGLSLWRPDRGWDAREAVGFRSSTCRTSSGRSGWATSGRPTPGASGCCRTATRPG